MKNHKCFSFWLPDKDADSFKKSLENARKTERRRIGVAEIVWPTIEKFIKDMK